MRSHDVDCPLCGRRAAQFYSVTDAPVTVASIFVDRAEALATPTGVVELAVCGGCGFVFNAAFDAALAEAGARYESSQAASPHFNAFARSLATEWIERHALSGRAILEVGCGGGEFMDILLDCGVGRAVGIDPLATSAASPGGAGLIADRFDAAFAGFDADALVCRHTLEHIADVRGFLQSVAAWADGGADRKVLFELPDAERIFSERAFWDVYYEHCNYFTAETLRFAFELAGLEVLRCWRAYGDQYLIVEAAAPRLRPMNTSTPDAQRAAAVADAFARDVRASIERCERSLEAFAAEKAPLVIWQGASKTVGFLAALSNWRRIDSAVDLSETRQGKFLPATGLPVHAPEKLVELRPRHIVLMNPVYLEEVRERVRELGVVTRVHAVNDLLV